MDDARDWQRSPWVQALLAEARAAGRQEILREIAALSPFAPSDAYCAFCLHRDTHQPDCLWVRAQAATEKVTPQGDSFQQLSVEMRLPDAPHERPDFRSHLPALKARLWEAALSRGLTLLGEAPPFPMGVYDYAGHYRGARVLVHLMWGPCGAEVSEPYWCLRLDEFAQAEPTVTHTPTPKGEGARLAGVVESVHQLPHQYGGGYGAIKGDDGNAYVWEARHVFRNMTCMKPGLAVTFTLTDYGYATKISKADKGAPPQAR